MNNPEVDKDAKPEVKEQTAEQFKELGNANVRSKSFHEAILNYSQAIKLNPADPILYSNRSLAFLKISHLYYANEDAEKAIELDPNWAKGYFRKAEVLFAAGQFDTALLSYAAALQRMPNDLSILEAAKRSAAFSNREKMLDSRVPWVGAGIGIIVGVIIVLLDHLAAKTPTLGHPALMVLVVMVLSGTGFVIAKTGRVWQKDQRSGLLDPPLDILEGLFPKKDEVDKDEETTTKQRNRYTKAQARQRFKKGKT